MTSGEQVSDRLTPVSGAPAGYIVGLITGAVLGGIGVTAAYVWFGLLRFVLH